MPLAIGIIASALLGCGVFMLYLAWRARGRRAYALLGWGLVVFGTAIWLQTVGGDKAVAYALISLSAFGLTFSAAQAFRRNLKRAKPLKSVRPARPKNPQTRRRPLAQAGNFIAVLLGGFLGAYVAALTGYNLGLATGLTAADAIVLALFLVPIMWAALASIWLMAKSVQFRLAWMLGAPTLCLGIIFLTRII